MPQPHAKRRPVQARVFLSFSGSLSRTVAEAFAQLLRKVLRGTESWMSQDIPPGANWRAKIDEALKNTKCAVIFLTRANHVAATWVAYEAGKARHAIVYAVNFDAADLAHQPYGAWQAAKADRPGTLAMLKEINRLAGGHEKDTELQKRFASHWPAFAGALREALESFPDHPYADLLHLRTFAGREVEVPHLPACRDRSGNCSTAMGARSPRKTSITCPDSLRSPHPRKPPCSGLSRRRDPRSGRAHAPPPPTLSASASAPSQPAQSPATRNPAPPHPTTCALQGHTPVRSPPQTPPASAAAA